LFPTGEPHERASTGDLGTPIFGKNGEGDSLKQLLGVSLGRDGIGKSNKISFHGKSEAGEIGGRCFGKGGNYPKIFFAGSGRERGLKPVASEEGEGR